jgi:hypothetical protein
MAERSGWGVARDGDFSEDMVRPYPWLSEGWEGSRRARLVKGPDPRPGGLVHGAELV